MTLAFPVALLLAAAPAATPDAGAAPVPQGPEPRSYTVGIMAALDEKTAAAQGIALGRFVSDVTGKPVADRVFKDYEALALAVAKGEVDFGLMGPLAYLRAETASKVQLVFRTVRNGQATYRAVLFAKPGSKLQSLADVKKASGLKVGWVDTSSATGYVLAKSMLMMAGIDPVKVFTVQDFAGSHDAVCKGVLDGTWDLGATFAENPPPGKAQASGCTTALGPKQAAAMAVVAETAPVPTDVLVAAPRISADLLARLNAAGKKAMKDPAGKKSLQAALLAEGVADVAPLDFDPVRKALESFQKR